MYSIRGDYHFYIHLEYLVSCFEKTNKVSVTIVFNIKLFFLINKLNASNLPPSEYSYLLTNQWRNCQKNVLIIYTPIPLQPFSHMWRVDRELRDSSINWKSSMLFRLNFGWMSKDRLENEEGRKNILLPSFRRRKTS